MNRNSQEVKSAGTLVARFGSPELSGTSGRGGIAVNGKTGEIYVSSPGEGNPGEGKVYVLASAAPAVTAGVFSSPACNCRRAPVSTKMRGAEKQEQPATTSTKGVRAPGRPS
jgi:hypothetical protein